MSNSKNARSNVVRPQTPQRPFFYKEESVIYQNDTDNITLSGTLTVPHGTGPFPAMILIAGMGPHDRDYSMMGHKLFLILSDFLTRNGIAVLRYDKRGIGSSTGSFGPHVTGKDLMNDVQAGIRFLNNYELINKDLIGLLGHSEGGSIAIETALRNSDIRFLVLLAAAVGTSIKDIVTQVTSQLQADGASQEVILLDQQLRTKLLTIITNEVNQEKAQLQMIAYARNHFDALSEATINALESYVLTIKKSDFKKTITLFNSPAYRYMLKKSSTINPISVPIFALVGSKDFITTETVTLPIIERALNKNMSRKSCIKVIDNANHWFQKCSSGAFAEYGTIKETINPEVLYLINKWIQETIR